MIQVHQIDRDAAGFDRNLWLLASMPVSKDDGDDVSERDEAVRALFAAHAYTLAALVSTTDLEHAYVATQNGVLTPSWSKQPVEGVAPAVPGYIVHKGEKYGYQSTSVGDVLTDGDKMYVVASFGFDEVPA